MFGAFPSGGWTFAILPSIEQKPLALTVEGVTAATAATAYARLGDTLVPLRFAAGQFAIPFPEDAHASCRAWAGPEPVFKVVVKVAARAS